MNTNNATAIDCPAFRQHRFLWRDSRVFYNPIYPFIYILNK